jgi:hypothetical protein
VTGSRSRSSACVTLTFFIILNLAIGGQWPGSPDQSTPLPAQMLVDYVQVYKAM